MAITLTKDWQNVGYKSSNIGASTWGFYIQAKYSSQSTDENKTYFDVRLVSVNERGTAAGSNYNFACSYCPTVSGGSVWTMENETITSGSGSVIHNDVGDKRITLSASMQIGYLGYYDSFSCEVDMPHINRKAVATAGTNFTDEGNPSITFNKAGVGTLSVWIEPNPNGTHYAERNNIPNTGSYTWELTESEREQLRRCCTNSNNCTCRLGIYTTINGTAYSSYVDKTFSIINANPSISSSDLSYSDTNSDTVHITQDNQKIIQSLSLILFTFNEATAQKHASIDHYELTFDGNVYNIAANAEEKIVNYGQTELNNNSNVSLKVVDSRGNFTTITKTVNILEWSLPNVNVVYASRVNNFEDDTHIKVDVNISSVANINRIDVLKVRYKKTIDQDYGQYVDIQNNTDSLFLLDKLYAWNIQILTWDRFGSTTVNLIVAKGVPIMFIDTVLKSIGINQFPTEEETLEIDGLNVGAILSGQLGILLWTNSNPTASFAAQEIEIEDIETYKYFEVIFKVWNSDQHDQYSMEKVMNDGHEYILSKLFTANNNIVYGGHRTVKATSTGLYFSDDYSIVDTSAFNRNLVNNAWNIPIKIIGFK